MEKKNEDVFSYEEYVTPKIAIHSVESSNMVEGTLEDYEDGGKL